MAGKKAKLLTASMVRATMMHVRKKRYPTRDITMVLLSVKAGLRAGEIANLTWPMLLDAKCKLLDVIVLHDAAAKKLSGRVIPMNIDLRKAIGRLHKKQGYPKAGHVILSEKVSTANFLLKDARAIQAGVALLQMLPGQFTK